MYAVGGFSIGAVSAWSFGHVSLFVVSAIAAWVSVIWWIDFYVQEVVSELNDVAEVFYHHASGTEGFPWLVLVIAGVLFTFFLTRGFILKNTRFSTLGGSGGTGPGAGGSGMFSPGASVAPGVLSAFIGASLPKNCTMPM